MPPRHETTRKVLSLFAAKGDSSYGGEAVTQAEHALQAATLAEAAGAPAKLIVAALLHDVGHLLHVLPDDAPDSGVDDRHEDLAAAWLRSRFGDEVVEPVRLHVAAKRYLCASDPDYLATLSEPSVVSLKLQGGPMTGAEVAEFRRNPHWEAAVSLRTWDDQAKVAGLATPPLEHFGAYLDQVFDLERAMESRDDPS